MQMILITFKLNNRSFRNILFCKQETDNSDTHNYFLITTDNSESAKYCFSQQISQIIRITVSLKTDNSDKPSYSLIQRQRTLIILVTF